MFAAPFKRLFCSHSETVLRVKGDRLFTECLNCLHKSPGITTEKAYVPPTPRPVSRRISTKALNRMLNLSATEGRDA